MEFKDLDEIANHLENISNKLNGGNTPLDLLFTKSFMKEYTKFNSFNELLDSSDFTIETQEDFDNIPEKEFDTFIASVTTFSTFDAMLEKAGALYLESQFTF